MKAKLTGKINNISIIDGDTHLIIDATGKVETTNISAQKIELDTSIVLKSIIAKDMKIGAVITITLSDEEGVELN